MRRVLLIGIVMLLLGQRDAIAVPASNATYYCVVEAAGGVAFDTTSQKWEGVRFKRDSKFILKMKYIRSRTEHHSYSGDQPVTDFEVSLTKMGEKQGWPCRAAIEGNPISIDADGYFRCTTEASRYTFNIEVGRFLESYEYGYVMGKDNNEDTPAMSVGTCTKIE